MPKPKVTVLNKKKQVNPIVRDRDNTDDLQLAELKVRTKYTKLDAPEGLIPGRQTTSPPNKTTNLPS